MRKNLRLRLRLLNFNTYNRGFLRLYRPIASLLPKREHGDWHELRKPGAFFANDKEHWRSKSSLEWGSAVEENVGVFCSGNVNMNIKQMWRYSLARITVKPHKNCLGMGWNGELIKRHWSGGQIEGLFSLHPGETLYAEVVVPRKPGFLTALWAIPRHPTSGDYKEIDFFETFWNDETDTSRLDSGIWMGKGPNYKDRVKYWSATRTHKGPGDHINVKCEYVVDDHIKIWLNGILAVDFACRKNDNWPDMRIIFSSNRKSDSPGEAYTVEMKHVIIINS